MPRPDMKETANRGGTRRGNPGPDTNRNSALPQGRSENALIMLIVKPHGTLIFINAN